MANKNSDKKCLHCSTSFSGEGEFCCHGCKAAYNIISSLKLKNFYKYIDNQIDRSDLNLQDKKFDDIDISEFIIEDDTSQDSESTRYTLNLMVDDLHCPSCVWLIEEVLKKQPEIIHARLNMSTKRLVINWRGERFYGNKYVNLIRKLGYNVRSYDPNISSFEDRKKQQSLLVALAVAAFASGNIMLLSVSLWSTSQEVMGIATRDFIHLISAIIAIPTIIFSGRVFFASAFKALINGRSNMDVPISIAIILTALVSVWEWLNSAEHTYFDSVTMLTFFLLIGRYLDVRTRNKARSAVAEMVSYANNSAQKILDNGSVKMIPSSKLQIGDIIQVNAGDKIPIDGVIISGKTEVDMSIINGESVPKEISKDDEVFAGTLNLGQTIKVKVTEISDKSLLSEIIKLIEKSEDTKTKYDLISDKAISLYSPIVYFSGLITLIFWYILVDIAFKDAVIIAISVLIITCPCAFGLAVPTVQILSSGALFKRGIMLKNPNALEILSHVSTVIFDKTGTITLGRFELKNRSDISDADFDIAYSMAINSSHPYSKAISNVGSNNNLIKNLDVKEVTASGLEAKFKGDKYRLGKAKWALSEGYHSNKNSEYKGLILSKNGNKLAEFIFDDVVREDAKSVISSFKSSLLKVMMISGDNKTQVEKIAKDVNIEDYIYEALPADKVAHIEQLKSSGEVVAMVGDGLNDAPALAAADISISPANAIDITKNSADIVFQGGRLQPLSYLYNLSKKSTRIIKQNFFIAYIYNIIAIPIAFAGYVTPLIAAIAMSLSSIIVVLNSFRVR